MDSRLCALARWVLGGIVLLGSVRVAAQSGPSPAGSVESFAGAFTLSVPITAPAYRSLEPNLQLSYSSMGGNGIVGVGWSLGGLSGIERASRGRGTPKYDASDIFLLDGQELERCTRANRSPSCITGGTHSTRIENYQRIRYDSSSNTWSVWRKDGTRFLYTSTFPAFRKETSCSTPPVSSAVVSSNPRCPIGVLTHVTASGNQLIFSGNGGFDVGDSHEHCSGKLTATLTGAPQCTTSNVPLGTFRWDLTKVTDTIGNTVHYGWQCEGSPATQCYPDTVTYNGVTVKFHRELRPDPITFSNGSSFQGRNNYRLKSIDVSVNGVRLRAYKLTYSRSASTQRSLLVGIQQFGRDAILDSTGTVTSGTSFPASTYTYDSAAGVIRNRTWTTGGHGVGDAGSTYADIDGDGKAEYVTHSKNGTHYATFFNADGTLTNRTWPGGHGVGDAGSTYADIDGDGKAEYVTHSTNGTHYATFFTGPTVTNRTWPGGHGVGDSGWGYLDINGDGQAEYVTHSKSGAYYATFFHGDTVTNWQQGGGHGLGDAGRAYADINGDGHLEYVTHSNNGGHFSTSFGGGEDLLSSTTHELGGTTQVEYQPSSAWKNTYLPSGLVLRAVSSVTVKDGRGASSTTRYQYLGGLWSVGERRFLGYRKVTAVLDAAGNYTETYYHQHVGCISKPEATYYRDAAGNIYKYSTFGYTESARAPYTSLMTERWEYECNQTPNCRRTLLQISYDQYGNGHTAYEYGDYDVTGDERTSVRGIHPNTTDYITGLPAYENIYAAIGTAGPLLKQTLNEYDQNGTYAAPPTKGILVRRRAWDNQTGGYVTRSFAHDAWGNVISETDPRGFTTTTEYDSTYHLYETKKCNALGHCSTKSWDGGQGLVLSETDINGGVTSYTHDALGRPLQTKLPDGSTETFAYLSWGRPDLQRIRRTLSDGSKEGLWTEVYEDGLGRRYKTVKKGGLVQESLYNDGSTRVWKQSAWYGPGETPQYQVFSFDGLGRLRRVTNPDGTYGQHVYGNGYVVTFDELGQERVEWRDAYGQKSQIREKNGGSYLYTKYQYDLLGNLVRVEDVNGGVTTVTWDSLGRKRGICEPNTGCSSFSYDAGGLLLTQSDARGQLIRFTYDALGRPRFKTYPDGQAVEWKYDEPGHGASLGVLTMVIAPSGTESRNYDAAGRVTLETRCVGERCYSTKRGYDLAGRLASLLYPDGEAVRYTYDAAGRLASVGGYVTQFSYNGRGQVVSATFGNGTTTRYSYSDTRQWLTSASVTVLDTPLYDATYGYDAAGRVSYVRSSSNPISNTGYVYDDLNRLTQTWGAQGQTLAYDAVGNITHNSQVGAYRYDDPAHPHAVTSAGGVTYSYDASGNMVAGKGRTLEWDSDNRLASVTQEGITTTFAYDANGQRVKRSSPSGTTYFFGPLLELGPEGLIRYYFAGPQLVARRGSSGVHWYHQDHLGSIRLITDEVGAKVASYDYAAFGTRSGSAAPSLSNDRGYTGHVTDETGLVYMNARYYDPELGRFLSADTLVPDSHNPQALNRYTYVYNNPISNTDPTGHAPVVAAIVTAVSIGATAGYASTTFIIAVVGAATVTTGYVLKNPVLMSIGNVLLGASAGFAFGAGFLGNVSEFGAAWAGGAVAALTSPSSPLDPGWKTAIGWAYTAQSLLHRFIHMEDVVRENARDWVRDNGTIPIDKGKKMEYLSKLSTAERAAYNDPNSWNSRQSMFGEFMELVTGGGLTKAEAIALNLEGGLIGPGNNPLTALLEVVTGWLPDVRTHAVMHDAFGRIVKQFGTGPGYPYTGANWFGLSNKAPFAGALEGLFAHGGNSISAVMLRSSGGGDNGR